MLTVIVKSCKLREKKDLLKTYNNFKNVYLVTGKLIIELNKHSCFGAEFR
jgi:hypothetical protein